MRWAQKSFLRSGGPVVVGRVAWDTSMVLSVDRVDQKSSYVRGRKGASSALLTDVLHACRDTCGLVMDGVVSVEGFVRAILALPPGDYAAIHQYGELSCNLLRGDGACV
jgi:hypothetical protein